MEQTTTTGTTKASSSQQAKKQKMSVTYSRDNTIVLFDVDGTLTKPRNEATEEMKELVQALRKKVKVGVVGGSDLSKIQEQLGKDAPQVHDYLFAENGLVYYKDGQLKATGSIKDKLGEDNLKKLINYLLIYIANADVPIKRGNFIEFRNGMLNVSLIGRNCTQQERDEYYAWDNEHGARAKMVADLQKQFGYLNLTFSIGGQISVDIFPQGWDKTYCLQFLDEFENVFFFGDKTSKGGNDYEIFSHERTQASTVTSPEHTMALLREKFSL